jgi:hypothetical protein
MSNSDKILNNYQIKPLLPSIYNDFEHFIFINVVQTLAELFR